MSKDRMQQEKENTFRSILDVAWDIAIKEGMDAISIRKIANALNFAPNNLYNYFKNKNELLVYMKKDAYQWAISIITNNQYQANSICALFKQISEKLLCCAIEEPEKYYVMTSDVIIDDKEQLDTRLTEFFEEKIKQGIASGELAVVDPVITAINMRMIQVGFVRKVSSNKSITLEKALEMHDNLMNIMYDGIRRKC